jgi:hypothetical protein
MKRLILFIMLLLMVGVATALPTTGAVTGIDANKVTFNAVGGSGEAYFKWGTSSGYNYFWTTPNQSVSGAFTDYQEGMPMLSRETYYVVACDSTGCGNEVSFVVPAATPLNQTSYGVGAITIMRNGFNITKTLPLMPTPFTNALSGPWVYALLFFFIFSSWWMRQGDVTIPMIVALVFGFTIWGGGSIMGMPGEVMNVGMGLCIAAVAGLFFSFFSK